MIFITGDLHGEIEISKLNSRKYPEQKNLTKSDIVINAGDFGLVLDDRKEGKYWLKFYVIAASNLF